MNYNYFFNQNEINDKTEILGYFDGLCQPINPSGIATYGFVLYIKNHKDKILISQQKGLVGKPFSSEISNNIAEYVGAIKLLQWLNIKKIYTNLKITVKGDSQLVIYQIMDKYKVKSEKLKILYNTVKKISDSFRNLKFEWIPRENNQVADSLSNDAYIRYLEKNYDTLSYKIWKYFATPNQRDILDKYNIKYGKYLSKIEAYNIIKKL